MIYFFTWDNSYLVKEKTLEWKNIYIKKYWDFSLTHFKDLKNIWDELLIQEILSLGFMNEKKLIIIDDFPLKAGEKDQALIQKQDLLQGIITDIPENNIVLFSSSSPDKRSKFYKAIIKNVNKVEEFNSKGDSYIYPVIKSKFDGLIDIDALNLLIKYKGGHIEKIISEIEKLLITNDRINKKLVEDNIFPELEESIFQFIDDIMNLNIYPALEKLDIILSQVSVYSFYNNLISNLRNLVFISNLKLDERVPSRDISEILDLGNRSFLVNKRYKISLETLNSLYIGLIDLDKKMKSGKMIGSEDKVLKYEIEKELLKVL